MNKINVKILSGQEPFVKNMLPDFVGSSGKIHVVAYAHVPAGEDQTQELEVFFKHAIADKPGWELTGIVTDEELSENSTANCWINFFALARLVRKGEVDILLTKSINNLAGRINYVKFLVGFSMIEGKIYFIQDDGRSILSTDELFML